MWVWIVSGRDYSDCYYEGDAPEIRVKIFSSKEKADAFVKEDYLRAKSYRAQIYWDVEEVEVDSG